jgi:DNA-binding response OmpR family regulator
MSTILVVEDDRQIRRVVQLYLEQAGMTVLTAADGPTGLALAQHEKPAIIILDLLLPGLDGREIARRLRQSGDPALAGVHILMLTALDDEQDRIDGFMLGADDYLGKPFSPRELVARVQATLRRLEQAPTTGAARIVSTGSLRLDPGQRRATLDQQELALTAVEFDLLLLLARHPGRIFSRDELIDHLTPAIAADPPTARTIDSHIKNLRKKLGNPGRHNRWIETVHGVGYRVTG